MDRLGLLLSVGFFDGTDESMKEEDDIFITVSGTMCSKMVGDHSFGDPCQEKITKYPTNNGLNR